MQLQHDFIILNLFSERATSATAFAATEPNSTRNRHHSPRENYNRVAPETRNCGGQFRREFWGWRSEFLYHTASLSPLFTVISRWPGPPLQPACSNDMSRPYMSLISYILLSFILVIVISCFLLFVFAVRLYHTKFHQILNPKFRILFHTALIELSCRKVRQQAVQPVSECLKFREQFSWKISGPRLLSGCLLSRSVGKVG